MTLPMSPYLHPCWQKPFEKRRKIVAEPLDDVAALLHQQRWQTQAADALTDHPETLDGGCEICGGIADMGVEAERNDQYGGARPSDGGQPRLDRLDIACVLRPRRQRQVQIAA